MIPDHSVRGVSVKGAVDQINNPLSNDKCPFFMHQYLCNLGSLILVQSIPKNCILRRLEMKLFANFKTVVSENYGRIAVSCRFFTVFA